MLRLPVAYRRLIGSVSSAPATSRRRSSARKRSRRPARSFVSSTAPIRSSKAWIDRQDRSCVACRRDAAPLGDAAAVRRLAVDVASGAFRVPVSTVRLQAPEVPGGEQVEVALGERRVGARHVARVAHAALRTPDQRPVLLVGGLPDGSASRGRSPRPRPRPCAPATWRSRACARATAAGGRCRPRGRS